MAWALPFYPLPHAPAVMCDDVTTIPLTFPWVVGGGDSVGVPGQWLDLQPGTCHQMDETWWWWW